MIISRMSLDRRRLEDAHIIYAVLNVMRLFCHSLIILSLFYFIVQVTTSDGKSNAYRVFQKDS